LVDVMAVSCQERMVVERVGWRTETITVEDGCDEGWLDGCELG